MTIRRAFNRMHLWLGLISAIPILLLSVTGTLLVYEEELIRWEHRRAVTIQVEGQRQSLQSCLEAARAYAPDLKLGTMHLPKHPQDALRIVSVPAKQAASFSEYTAGGEATPWILSINPYSAQVVDQRKAGGGLMTLVREFHLSFLAGKTGHWIVGVSTIIFLLIMGSGLFLWFKRGGGWRKLLIKWDAKGKRFHYDIHANFGLYSSIFLLLIALSGVLIWIGTPWRDGLLKVTKSKWRQVPKLPVEITANETLISLDRALEVADSTSPETKATMIQLPKAAKDPISVSRRFWWGSRPPLTVAVHPVSGAVFDVDDPRQYESGHLIHRLNRGLHSGEIGTWVMRILWFLVSLVPPLLIYTGWKLWRKSASKAVEDNFQMPTG